MLEFIRKHVKNRWQIANDILIGCFIRGAIYCKFYTIEILGFTYLSTSYWELAHN